MRNMIFFILMFAYTLPSFAQTKTDGAGFAAAWGANAVKLSGIRNNNGVKGVACEGTSKAAGLTEIDDNTTRGDMRRDLRNYYLDYNTQYYIAREINQNGAKFCKTVISGTRGGCTGKSHTTYYDPSGSTDCFWLCKQGFYGDSCSGKVSSSATPSILPEQFIAKKAGSGVVPMGKNPKSSTNIEENIPMFEANKYIKCSTGASDNVSDAEADILLKNWASANGQEHDLVLALKEIRKDGKVDVGGTPVDAISFVVQPMAVRAGTTYMCAEKGNNVALPMVAFVGEEQVVCPSDYEWYEVSRFGMKQMDLTSGGVSSARGLIDRVQSARDKVGQLLTSEEIALVQNDMLNGYRVTRSIVCIDPTARSRTEQEKIQQFNENLLKNLCPDFKRDGYNVEVHDLYVFDKESNKILEQQPGVDDTVVWSNKCAKYKCKNASLGFKSDWKVSGDMGCYECIGDPLRFGIDDEGTCQLCNKGDIFDSENDKKCEKANTFTKNDMRFGAGKPPSATLAGQCWIQDNPICYACCLLNNQNSENCRKNCTWEQE